MKLRTLSVSLATALSMLAVPVSAITVFDPSNFVQNTLTAVRTLEQINNQIQQLQHAIWRSWISISSINCAPRSPPPNG